MPGPTPKDPTLRARRNKTATAARLSLVPPVEGEEPEVEAMRASLPPRRVEEKRDDGSVVVVEAEWHERAVALWEELWTSPMRGEYLDADVEGLYVLVAMTDAFWRRLESGQVSGANELGKELRLQRQQYGLDPIARRRLQWEVDRGDEAEERRRKRNRPRPAEGDSAAKPDPRALLGADD
jgi:hypothetical protein